MRGFLTQLLNLVFRPDEAGNSRNLGEEKVEKRVSEAEYRLERKFQEYRDQIEWRTERQLDELAKKKWKPLTITLATVAAISFVLNILYFFKGKQFLQDQVKLYVDSRLIEPNLEQRVRNAVSTNAGRFVKDSLAPIEARAQIVEVKIANFERDISSKQSELANKQLDLEVSQRSIRDQQAILELAASAKGGESFAYDRLKQLAQQQNRLGGLARAAEIDVGFYFMYFVRPENNLTHSSNGKPITESVEDDVWHLFQSDTEGRVVSAYQLRHHKKASTLLPLVEALKVETNLFARAEMVMAIGALKGQNLHCLDIEAALSAVAAETNSASTNFWYTCFFRKPRSVNVATNEIDESIRCATVIVDSEPYALRTRCFRGWCYAKRGDRTLAFTDFTETERLSPNFPWLWFYRGLTEIGFNEESAGISSLNRAFQARPELAEYAISILAPRWRTNSEIRWPKQ